MRLVLTEVLFAPRDGDTTFVELANVGSGAVDLSAFVLRIDTLELPLPRLEPPLARGDHVLIRFDGRGTVEGHVVHTDTDVGLRADGGTVTLLLNDDRVVDRVAWGTAPGAIMPPRGGRAPPRVEPGSSLGRPPGANQTGAASDWVMYAADQVTPGQPNPMPAVVQLLPLDGAILDTSPVELGWYVVPGAVRYRIQLAKDTAFGETLVNQTVAEPPVSSGPLALGVYWWRVQAVGPGDVAAPWSRPHRLELAARSGGNPPGLGGLGSADLMPEAPVKAVTLNVPYLRQHKDTKMLLLESQQEGTPRTAARLPRPPHQWDRDHGTLDQKDPADNMNCCLASLAMINHFFGGDLSQDRIGYEVFSRNVASYASRVNVGSIGGTPGAPLKEQAPGPEFDLNYGTGFSDERILAAGLYALGTLPGKGSGYLPLNGIWTLVMAEIDAGRPLLGFNATHCFVVRGYELRGARRLLYVNDPWSGPYAFDIDAAGRPLGQLQGVLSYPNHAAATKQEPSVTADSDGDGVVDFDEINRFHTNPNNRDTDADLVPDKEDIKSGIYELEHPYGYAWNPAGGRGRDFDGDGIPTELDPDSDGGGCKDGDEDLDKDGFHNGSESGNFDQTDDECGDLQGNVSYTDDLFGTDPNQIIKRTHQEGTIQVRLKREAPGSDHFVDYGSTWSYRGYSRIEIDNQGCKLYGRASGAGAGNFTIPDADIGATSGNDGTLAFAAGAPVRGRSAAGGCKIPWGGDPNYPMGLGFPNCTGVRSAKSLPGWITYRFNCNTTTTHPTLPGVEARVVARGYVRLK